MEFSFYLYRYSSYDVFLSRGFLFWLNTVYPFVSGLQDRRRLLHLSVPHPRDTMTAAPANAVPTKTIIPSYCPPATLNPDLRDGWDIVSSAWMFRSAVEIGVESTFPNPRENMKNPKIVVESAGSSSAANHKPPEIRTRIEILLAIGLTNPEKRLDHPLAKPPYKLP